jgi:nifR3 family TIM-barrel protein
MAEISTPALRRVIRRFSSKTLLFSEMLSAGSIASGAPHNEPLLAGNREDPPLIYQVVGNNPEVMARASSMLEERGCLGVDINMGCPVSEIIRRGQGSALLGDLSRAGEIVRACRKAVTGTLSVKMRIGLREADEKFLKNFLSMLQSEGIDFVTIHGRTARQGYTRTSDWGLVGRMAAAIRVPVFGNGDITSAREGRKRLEESGCHGIMIGRGGVDRPWLYGEIEGKSFEVDREDVCVRVLEGIRDLLPEHLHRSRSHRFLARYVMANALFGHELFTRLRKEEEIDSMISLVRDYYARHEEERYIFCGRGEETDEDTSIQP